MSKLGGSGLVIAGLFLAILGAFLQSGIVEWLLDILGLILIVAGIVIGVYGLIRMFSGSDAGSSDY